MVGGLGVFLRVFALFLWVGSGGLEGESEWGLLILRFMK